jgi:hypothetical protein
MSDVIIDGFKKVGGKSFAQTKKTELPQSETPMSDLIIDGFKKAGGK